MKVYFRGRKNPLIFKDSDNLIINENWLKIPVHLIDRIDKAPLHGKISQGMSSPIDQLVLESGLRQLSADRLSLLRLFTERDLVTSAMISNATVTNASYRELGGVISTLLRTRIEGKPLVKRVGLSGKRREKKAVLEINKDSFNQGQLKQALDNIKKLI